MALSEKEIREALMDVYDPEIGVDIVSLGLIYKIEIKDTFDVIITMTFTFPGCPYGPALLEDIEDRVRMISSVRNVAVNLVFDPPWTPDCMDPDVKAALNFK
ncbi:MAG: metal-sulfur cluster assembly factor [Candidatus Nanoarchaeia archaeon]